MSVLQTIMLMAITVMTVATYKAITKQIQMVRTSENYSHQGNVNPYTGEKGYNKD